MNTHSDGLYETLLTL